jgi:hypothetical protein
VRRAVTGGRRAALAMLAVAGGCAWGEGEHFAVLTARVDAALDAPADRDAGEGWLRLASDHQVRFTGFEVTAGEVVLLDSGGAALGFDPARPPPGYSLCHGGHCHRGDGSLPTYEEVAAELAGGGGAVIVVVLPVGELDLHAGESVALDCVPGCGLPLAAIGAGTLDLGRLRAEGLVRDSREPARIDGEVPWHLDLDLAASEVALAVAIDLPADRRHPPRVSLTLRLALGAPLFDAVVWPEPALDDGRIDLAADPDATLSLLAALAGASVRAEVTRN